MGNSNIFKKTRHGTRLKERLQYDSRVFTGETSSSPSNTFDVEKLLPSPLILKCDVNNRKVTINGEVLLETYPDSKILIYQLMLAVQVNLQKGASFSIISQFPNALRLFLKFLHDKKRLNKKAVHTIADIDFSICNAFKVWLIKNGTAGVGNKGFTYLKRLIASLVKHPKYSKIPAIGNNVIHWPCAPRKNETPLESLDDLTFNGMIRAVQDDFDLFRKTLGSRKKLIEQGKMIYSIDWSLPNTVWWYKNYLKNTWPQGQTKEHSTLTYHLRKLGLSSKTFISICKEKGDELATKGRHPNPYPQGRKKDESLTADILFTVAMLFPDWPLEMPPGAAMKLFSHEGRKVAYPRLYELLRRKKSFSSPLTGLCCASGLLDYLYPQNHLVFSLFLLCRIQTGWNTETLLSISLTDNDAIVDDPLDPNKYALIYGKKNRPTPKEVPPHRSNKQDRYGVYAVLLFLKEHGEKLRELSGSSSPWLFLRDIHMWETLGYVGCLKNENRDGKISFHRLVRTFFRRHAIYDDAGRRVAHININRIRTTYASARTVQWEGNVKRVQFDMGHENIDTTINHYNSDAKSKKLKDKKIFSLQNKILTNIRAFAGSIVRSYSMDELRRSLEANRTIKLKKTAEDLGDDFHLNDIIYIISDEAQTFIAACRNSYKPTWSGHEKYIRAGEKCFFFNGCATCKQVIIFKEALPYVIRRIEDLESLKSEIPLQDWALSFSDEYAGWVEVIENWGNESDIRQARETVTTKYIRLPILLNG